MHRTVVAVAALVLGTMVAWAQSTDVIKQRREAMQTMARAGTANFLMMKGDKPFDMATARAGLKTFQEVMPKFKDLFPDNSKGGDSEATEKVWEQRAAFNAAIEKLIADAKAAEAGTTDEASFKKLYPAVAANCGNCHKERDGFAPKLADSLKRLQQ